MDQAALQQFVQMMMGWVDRAALPGSVPAGTDGPVPPHQRPGSQRSWCRMISRVMAPAFLRDDISVSTGRPSFETVGR